MSWRDSPTTALSRGQPSVSNLRRSIAPVALILLTALVVWPLRDAFDAFVERRGANSPMTWALGMTWAFDFAWSFVLGALMGAVVRSGSAILWAAAAGISYGALNFAITQHHLSSSLTWNVYAWIYGQYLVSFVSAMFGAWTTLCVLRRPPREKRPAM